MELKGIVKFIGEMKSVGTNGFNTRDIWITTAEQYPQTISVQFTQDKCDLLNLYKIGEAIVIAINLRGREWTNDKGETVVFNTIQGWKISKDGSNVSAPTPVPSQPALGQKTYKHTATDFTEEQYRTNPVWTTAALVANGKGVYVENGVPNGPAAPEAPETDLPF